MEAAVERCSLSQLFNETRNSDSTRWSSHLGSSSAALLVCGDMLDRRGVGSLHMVIGDLLSPPPDETNGALSDLDTERRRRLSADDARPNSFATRPVRRVFFRNLDATSASVVQPRQLEVLL